MRSLSGDQEQDEEWAMIRAGLDDLKKRVDLLPELRSKGFEEEALLLCCCYIEAMGNLYYGDGGRQHNFYRVLKDFGGEAVLIRIHPKQLWIAFRSSPNKSVQAIAQKIGGVLRKAGVNLYSEAEIVGLVSQMLDEKERTIFSKNLWRGSLAALAYMHFRNPAVHELGGAKSFSFEETRFNGKSTPVLDFSLLYKELLKILNDMREISIETRTYFGQNFDTLLHDVSAIHKEWDELT